jgi:hypothetical protein
MIGLIEIIIIIITKVVSDGIRIVKYIILHTERTGQRQINIEIELSDKYCDNEKLKT